MDNERAPHGPGKTSARLVQDLFDYDPRRSRKNGSNLLADPAPRFRGKKLAPRTSPSDCRHSLIRKDNQTTAPISNDEQPDNKTKYVVATYCSKCRYHFKISVDYRHKRNGQTPCRLNGPNPMHHLQLVASTDAKKHKEEYGEDKYNTFTEGHRFLCSAPACPVVVEIEISPPRLGKQMLSLIDDPKRVEVRGRRVIQEEPERYDGLKPLNTAEVLGVLQAYVRDALSKDPNETKRIAVRNKKFTLAFADECDGILEYLDFKLYEEPPEDPAEEAALYWKLPDITQANRHFLEDVLYEVRTKLEERPEPEKSFFKFQHSPVYALKDIERSFGYFDYQTRSRTIDLSIEEHPYYASLGAVDDFADDLLSWAYDRQCAADPSNKPYYLDCLSDLAKGRESADLQEKVAMAISVGEIGLTDIEEAYRFFALEPDTSEGDDHIIGVFTSRIDSAPRQKDQARQCLLTIGKSRGSAKIQEVANDRTMSFEEALEFLNVSSETASDSIEAAAVAMSLDADKSRVARALRVIANHRSGDYTLQRAAESMESGSRDSTLDVSDAYSRLQILDPTAPDDTVLTYYRSLSSGAPDGSKASYTEALRVIAHDRQSAFLLAKLDDPDANVQATPKNEPVGLDNIGNTCYLNSLLQYYYTVNAVRDLVINFEQNRMALNQEDIKKKRVGGRAVVKSEIIKAQKFVDELHNLFENLRTASARSVKPTRELAELTIFSSAAEANFRRASISSPGGLPNLSSIMGEPVYGPELPPPVPSRPSPMPIVEEIEMTERPVDKSLENADDSSEATLVDLDQLPAYSEITDQSTGAGLTTGDNQTRGKRIDAMLCQNQDNSEDNTSQEEDTVMVNGEPLTPQSSNGHSIGTSPPDKPPPVPPRNKSGLSIQTSEKKEILNDELWRFGTQQDVTEVIGNVLFRLQCAIKPTSIDEDGGQRDNIKDTFYGESAFYLHKAQKVEKKVEEWANLIVYPAVKGPRDIYEALDVVFDEQDVEIDNSLIPQHTSINKLPPILQIQINRTQFNSETQRAWKNTNPVTFPQTIYLDRYMDSDDLNSTLMFRRRETWKWKSQLKALEARRAILQTTEIGLSVPEALVATKDLFSVLQEEVDGVAIHESLPEACEERGVEAAQELNSIKEKISEIKKKLQEQFTDMRRYQYQLHTVFIHRGEASGGHYWIYVYDFEQDIWREYNDEYVSIIKDRRRIFDHTQGGGGTPYYLSYVRSRDWKDLVNAVHRDAPTLPEPEARTEDVASEWAGGMDYDNVEMVDGAQHVEHVKLKKRELRPKPAIQADAGATDEWPQPSVWDPMTSSKIDPHGKTW